MTTHDIDDERKLAERYPAMRKECPELRYWHSSICEICQGREYVPNITETAMLDVLFAWAGPSGEVLIGDCSDYHRVPEWHCTVSRFIEPDGWFQGDAPTRHAALVAAVLALPDEVRS